MKIVIEVNRKEYNELPDSLDIDNIFLEERDSWREIYYKEAFDHFIKNVKEKFDYTLTMTDLRYQVDPPRTWYGEYCLSIKAKTFLRLFWYNLSKRDANLELYVLDINSNLYRFSRTLKIRKADVSNTNQQPRKIDINITEDLPDKKIMKSQWNTINIKTLRNCSDDIKNYIKEQAYLLYSELYNTLLEAYKELNSVYQKADLKVAEIKNNKYYYVDSKDHLLLMLDKNNFKNKREADHFAKKELYRIYNKTK